jgi:hypothetical protein
VRRGASWTAAYHRQLTVAAVARPVPSSVGAPGVLAAARSWWLLAQTTSAGGASSRSRGVGRRRRGRPCQQARHGVGRRCPPMRCPPIGVRDPAVRPSGVRSPGVVVQRVRRSAVCCPPVRCPAVRCPAVWCPAVRPDAFVSSHAQAVALGTRSRWPGDRDHRIGWRPRWLAGRRPLDRRSRRPGRGRRCPTRVGQGGGRWLARAAGLGVGRGGRACLLSDQAGQAGVRSAPRGRRRFGHGSWLQREVAAPAAWLGSSGWVRDHGGWSSPSLTPGRADPEGPGEVPAGMGVRPQRGPSRQRARPARCWQRSDVRRWLVGLPGLEPGTSSLSGIEG